MDVDASTAQGSDGGSSTFDVQKGALDAALAEYTAMRQEICTAIQASHTVLNFGVVALGLFGGGGFGLLQDEPEFAPAIFLYAIPLTSAFLLSLWLAEILRVMKLGVYLSQREPQINAQLLAGSELVDPLGWEAFAHLAGVRKAGAEESGVAVPDIEHLYRRAVGPILFAIGAGSLGLGTLLAFREWPPGAALAASLLGGALFLLPVRLFLRLVIQGDDLRATAYGHKPEGSGLERALNWALRVQPPALVADATAPQPFTLEPLHHKPPRAQDKQRG